MSNPHRYRPIDVLNEFASALKFACTVKDFDPADHGSGAEFGRGIHKFLDPSNWGEPSDHGTLIYSFLDDLHWAIQRAENHPHCRGYVPGDSHTDNYVRAFRAMFGEIADIETGKLEV